MKPNIFRKVLNSIEKNSPTILVVAGITGVVAGTVMVAKAAVKAEPVIEETNSKIDAIEERLTCESTPEQTKALEKEKRDTTIVAVKDIAKIYAGPAAVMTISLGCIIFSNRILNKRNAALAAAYATLDACFKDYRKQIVEKYGEDVDTSIRYNLKVKKNKDGTKEYIATDKTLAGYSEYAKFFDELSTQWESDAEYNRMFLLQIQSWANATLQTKGKLFLNEVYRALGLPETKAGQIVGWIYDPNNDKTDSFVQFLDVNDPTKKLFIDGVEKSVLLDFNVDGVIWDKLVW